jgi:EmrB/QacA subfamily drug resistance transporter
VSTAELALPLPARQSHNVTLAVLASSGVAYAFAQTMVAPALPEIGRDLGASPTASAWALTAFLLTGSVATPILGRVGDIVGKQRVLIYVLAVFAFGALIAGISESLPLLIAGRAIQGTAGAIFPLAFGIVRDEFPPDKTAHGLGLMSATFGIGGGIGLCLSGVIVDHLSYSWIFWFSFLVAVAALLLVWRFVPESPVRSAATSIDYKGAVMLSIGLTAILLAISEGRNWDWTSLAVLGLLVAGVELLLGWIWFELGERSPLIDMRMMARRGVWTTNLCAVLVGFGMFSLFITIPQFVSTPDGAGYGFGASVAGAGLYLLPSTLLMLVSGPAAGALAQRFGPRVPLIGGSLVLAASFAWLAALHDTPLQVLAGLTLTGMGLGCAFAAMPAVVVRAVDATETGVATGMNTIMRTVGGSVGSQVGAALITAHVAANGLPSESGYTKAFAVCAVVVFLGAIAATLTPTD